MAACGEDELYFGSVAVHYAPDCTGTAIPYTHCDWAPDLSPAALPQVLARVECLGPESDIVVPGIPAVDIARKGTCGPSNVVEHGWPSCMQQPLIKVPESQRAAGAPKAFASGVRSGLLQGPEGEWYRLKGCGNNDEGFVVQTSATTASNPPTRQVLACRSARTTYSCIWLTQSDCGPAPCTFLLLPLLNLARPHSDSRCRVDAHRFARELYRLRAGTAGR
jgi:hypothetical protein